MTDLTEILNGQIPVSLEDKTKAAGKMLGTASGPLARWQERGVDWIAMGSDWGFMAQGFRNMLKERDER